ncbi:MAG: ECF transporter S component [Ruminococcus sp.]|jgi:riboflavin transporter FmnP|nr:ECF transporter S component [Ruminococcus sp.]
MGKSDNVRKFINVRKLTVTAILSAIAAVLQLLNFPVPFMPSFIQFDFSEFPALLASFAFGPVSGVTVCFIKNVIDLLTGGFSSTLGIGPLSNFLLGAAFTFTAGLIYKLNRTKKGAVTAALIGALVMAAVSFPSNLWLVYPIYEVAFFTTDQIIAAYNVVIEPITNFRLTSLWQCLLFFNLPFTLLKALISVILTMFTYKPLSVFLKGKG